MKKFEIFSEEFGEKKQMVQDIKIWFNEDFVLCMTENYPVDTSPNKNAKNKKIVLMN